MPETARLNLPPLRMCGVLPPVSDPTSRPRGPRRQRPRAGQPVKTLVIICERSGWYARRPHKRGQVGLATSLLEACRARNERVVLVSQFSGPLRAANG